MIKIRLKIDQRTPSHDNCFSESCNNKPLRKSLPGFDGNILEFERLIQLLESAVESKGYSNVDKLEALFQCLKGTQTGIWFQS